MAWFVVGVLSGNTAACVCRRGQRVCGGRSADLQDGWQDGWHPGGCLVLMERTGDGTQHESAVWINWAARFC